MTPGGILAVTRGIQTPPRDSLKLFATFVDALKFEGIDKPGKHLFLSRNYLATSLFAFKESPGMNKTTELISLTTMMGSTMDWYPKNRHPGGPEPDPSHPIAIGAKKIIGEDSDKFKTEWMYDIRPATDDKPYFHNFFKWKSLPWMIDTYGNHWFRRLELAYVILVILFVVVVATGVIFIFIPLLWLPKGTPGEPANRPMIFTYFLLLGIGFMVLEMTSILRFTQHLGGPLYATSLMITCFLLSAGLGSVLSPRIMANPHRRISTSSIAIVVLGLIHLSFTDPVMGSVIALPIMLKAVIAILITAPVGFFMGWLFPAGLQILSERNDGLLPWAWAINGFASVAAPPLALLLSMAFGFKVVLCISLACYALAGFAGNRMKSVLPAKN